MNYGLALSLKLETHLLALAASGAQDTAEERLEDRALKMPVEETFEESGKQWRPWAANQKSLRMGEIILIVGSDTVVPEDCLHDAAWELAECPEVGIIQHKSDVMQCISTGCVNGEAPFMGHNAFIGWSALQDAAFVDLRYDKNR